MSEYGDGRPVCGATEYTEIREEREIRRGINELNKELSCLEDEIGSLAVSIVPVMSSERVSEMLDKVKSGVDSPLAQDIYCATGRVEDARRRVTSLIERIEL